MSTPTVITIAGMTGALARLITKHILALPNTHINGLCRKPSKLPKSITSNPRVSIFQSSAEDIPTIRTALKCASVAICCYLGPNDFMVSSQKTLIDACILEDVPRYIAGDWSMDFRKLAMGEHPPKDPMKHIQAYLEERERDAEIKAVHILNACFLERPWVGLWDPKTFRLQYWGSGEEKWEFTTYDNAAEFTAHVAVDPDAVGYLSFRGDHRNTFEIASDFETVYGKKPELHCLGSLDDLYTTMHRVYDKDPEHKWAWLALFYTYYSISGQTTIPQPLDNDRYPDVKLTTVKDYFERTPLEKLGRWYGES